MKILMLTPYLPYPLLSGGQIRSYNLLKNLSKKHTITLFSFIRDTKETQYIPQLKEFCKEVKVFLKRPPWSMTSLTLSAISLYPLVVCMYLQRSFQKEIARTTQKDKFDLIHAETFYVMPNIPQNNIPTILVEQTIEYLVYQHFTESVQFLPLRYLMHLDVYKIRLWEKRFWQKATRVVAMSEADKQTMQKLATRLDVDLVPNGVDTEFFSMQTRKISKKEKIILFVGNFKWLQNREAVSLLIKEIWPKIQKALPEAKLWIVGRFPPRDILGLTNQSIIVSSDVEDIREAYKKADMLLAPIFGPGGTRYKILESMATGLPVVTTKTGIEGLGAVSGREALICEEYDELARATIQVLTDQSLYRRLAMHGRRLVEKKFNWTAIANSLDRIYEKAAYGTK